MNTIHRIPVTAWQNSPDIKQNKTEIYTELTASINRVNKREYNERIIKKKIPAFSTALVTLALTCFSFCSPSLNTA